MKNPRSFLTKCLQYFIAVILLSTAIGKLLDIQGFRTVIESYQIFSGWITAPIGLGMALFELFLSIWLFSGKKLKEAALASLGLHAIFIVWISIALARGLEIANCGCFGVFLQRPLNYVTVIEDLVMLAASGALYALAKRKKV